MYFAGVTGVKNGCGVLLGNLRTGVRGVYHTVLDSLHYHTSVDDVEEDEQLYNVDKIYFRAI